MVARLAIVALGLAIAGCALPPVNQQAGTSTRATDSAPTVLANLRAQLQSTIDGSSAAIAGGTLRGADLAHVLCTRAEALADLGNAAGGLADARAALQAAPNANEALLCHANLEFANGDFDAAVAGYTRALARTDDPFEALYRRGHAYFFAHRFDAAAADFARASATQFDDTARLYALLWQALALQRHGLRLPPALLVEATRKTHGDWPRPALALLAGVGSEAAMMGALDVDAAGEGHALALAEAWFYVGERRLTEGRVNAARDAFIAARAPGATMTLPHIAAGFELARLQR